MRIRDFISRRIARALKAGQRDVYQYDQLPEGFRVQVVHIWRRALGDFTPMGGSPYRGPGSSIWEIIEDDIAEAHAKFRLGSDSDGYARVANYFMRHKEHLKALDVIEAVFNAIDEHVRGDLQYASMYIKQHPDDAIADLNERFREHAIGYQYANGQLIKVDSLYLHAETVKPALGLLSDPDFAGAEDEFLQAHKHYRAGKI